MGSERLYGKMLLIGIAGRICAAYACGDYVGSWGICGVGRIVRTDPGLVRIMGTDPRR